MVYWFCAGMWCGFAVYDAAAGKWLKSALQFTMGLTCIAGALA